MTSMVLKSGVPGKKLFVGIFQARKDLTMWSLKNRRRLKEDIRKWKSYTSKYPWDGERDIRRRKKKNEFIFEVCLKGTAFQTRINKAFKAITTENQPKKNYANNS